MPLDPSAVISHHSAAAYWGIRRAPKDRVEITVPYGVRPRGVTAVVHYSNLIPDHHVVELIDRKTRHVGGPHRVRPRWVMDAQGHLSIIEDIRNKALCSDDELGEVYADLCGKGRRGSASWTRLADLTERVHRPTMSELELELQQALVAAGLPLAVQQHPVALPSGRMAYLDLAYVDCRLDIEVDHSEWHSTTSAVERDKVRDNGLAIIGWERLHFTERMLERARRVCVAQVQAVRNARLARADSAAA